MRRGGFPAAVVLAFAVAGLLLIVPLLLGPGWWFTIIPAAGLMIFAVARARALRWSGLATALVGVGSVVGAAIVIGFALSVR